MTAGSRKAKFTMAWRSSGNTNAELVENLYKNGLITSERVKVAMLGVSLVLAQLEFCRNRTVHFPLVLCPNASRFLSSLPIVLYLPLSPARSTSIIIVMVSAKS